MTARPVPLLLMRAVTLGFFCAALSTAQGPPASDGTPALFSESFESNLEQWTFPLGQGHALVPRADTQGTALELRVVDAPVYALIRGSAAWGNVRIEGEVLFPTEEHNYLGYIYRYVDDGRRIDFGSLYIKGNGSYLQANLHSDTNVGRTLYPEMRAALEGDRAIVIGQWQQFALEVVGPDAHLYVGDVETPAMTLPGPVAERGAFGFKPRNPGAAVQIDNILVRPIERFSYEGPAIPMVEYERDAFATEWSVLGPLTGHALEVETKPFDPNLRVEDDGRMMGWKPFQADHRGAVHTGLVTEFRGSRKVAYFHTRLTKKHARDALLSISTIDDLAIWLNDEFLGFTSRDSRAWWDSTKNEEHRGRRAPLRQGTNDILIRVVGGTYATGGFYVGLHQPEE